MKITSAIIPAAGLGTRFLPFTKAVPKELAPILNLPTLHYVIKEGIDSGIKNFAIVSSETKPAISHYLTPDLVLEKQLDKTGKRALLKEIDTLIAQASYTFPLQDTPKGLGHAVLCAREQVIGEHFGLFLPDDLLFNTLPNLPGLAQLIASGTLHNADGVIALARVPKSKISAYGVIEIEEQLDTNTFIIKSVVEKPSADTAPSDLAIVGRYVLPSTIFDILATLSPHSNTHGEILLTDAFTTLIARKQKLIGVIVNAERFDTGTPMGLLQANISLGLKDPRYSTELCTFLRQELDQYL